MLPSFCVIEQSKKSQARAGELRTAHGKIKTPFFMTIATRGAVKTLDTEDMRRLKAPILLSNTYHLFVRPGLEIIKKAGGLHKFMNWDKPILTDSGGYQVFSLAARNKNIETLKHKNIEPSPGLRPPSPSGRGVSLDLPLPLGEGWGEGVDYDVRITKQGAEFIDHKSGRKDLFTPEKVMEIQQGMGVDIAMVLDVCAPYGVSKQEARSAMEMTTMWAERSKRYSEHNPLQLPLTLMGRDRFIPPLRVRGGRGSYEQLLFGIVQGSVFRDLREQSARDLVKLDFDGYAIGGVAVGEGQEQKYQVLDWVTPLLPENKPRYLMGLGQPEEIVQAVRRGVDMFDCVLPTRNARHGNLYIRKYTTPNPSSKRRGNNQFPPLPEGRLGGVGAKGFYSVLHITNEQYIKDFKPLDSYCSCFTCTHHSRAYLRHLFKISEPLGQRLATIHNVHFYLELMRTIQQNIVAGKF